MVRDYRQLVGQVPWPIKTEVVYNTRFRPLAEELLDALEHRDRWSLRPLSDPRCMHWFVYQQPNDLDAFEADFLDFALKAEQLHEARNLPANAEGTPDYYPPWAPISEESEDEKRAWSTRVNKYGSFSS